MKIVLYTILILAVNLGMAYLVAQLVSNDKDGMEAFVQSIVSALITLGVLILLEFSMAYNFWKKDRETGISFLSAAIITLGFIVWEIFAI